MLGVKDLLAGLRFLYVQCADVQSGVFTDSQEACVLDNGLYGKTFK